MSCSDLGSPIDGWNSHSQAVCPFTPQEPLLSRERVQERDSTYPFAAHLIAAYSSGVRFGLEDNARLTALQSVSSPLVLLMDIAVQTRSSYTYEWRLCRSPSQTNIRPKHDTRIRRGQRLILLSAGVSKWLNTFDCSIYCCYSLLRVGFGLTDNVGFIRTPSAYSENHITLKKEENTFEYEISRSEKTTVVADLDLVLSIR